MIRSVSTMVDLYPAYAIACKRCRQRVWIMVTTLPFGGDRTGYALALGDSPESEHFACKVYELDLNVAQLRTEGVNATPPGLNLQSIPDKVTCHTCRMEYKLASLTRGRRLEDAAAFNCSSCGREGFCDLETLEETIPNIPEDRLPQLVHALRIGFADPETLLAAATMRIVVCEEAIVPIDRISLIPPVVQCLYCGTQADCKLLDPAPLR